MSIEKKPFSEPSPEKKLDIVDAIPELSAEKTGEMRDVSKVADEAREKEPKDVDEAIEELKREAGLTQEAKEGEVSKEILEALERFMGKEAQLTVVQKGETLVGVVTPEYIDGNDLCLTTEDGVGMFIKLSEI